MTAEEEKDEQAALPTAAAAAADHRAAERVVNWPSRAVVALEM